MKADLDRGRSPASLHEGKRTDPDRPRRFESTRGGDRSCPLSEVGHPRTPRCATAFPAPRHAAPARGRPPRRDRAHDGIRPSSKVGVARPAGRGVGRPERDAGKRTHFPAPPRPYPKRAYMPEALSRAAVPPNKKVVADHMAAKPAKAAEFLADDFEWVEWGDGVPPGGVRTRGKAAFVASFGDDELHDEVQRVVEEGNVVVVEGIAHVTKKDGKRFNVQFCNIFELDRGKIKRKSSYGALLKDSA